MANDTDNYILPLFRIRNGEGYYIVDDNEIPKLIWEAENPNPKPIVEKHKKTREDIDKTHIPY